MGDRTKTDVIKSLFGHKLLLHRDHHVFQPMEVLPIADLYLTVVIGTGSWIAPMGRKTPRKGRGREEELILPSMNGRWKTDNKGKTFSGVKKSPPSGLRVGSEDEENSKKRRTGDGWQHPTQ